MAANAAKSALIRFIDFNGFHQVQLHYSLGPPKDRLQTPASGVPFVTLRPKVPALGEAFVQL